MSWNAWDGTDISTALFPVSCAYSDKTTWRLRWKIPLETPGNAISLTLLFKTSLDASVLKSLCLWRKFQSCLLFIINLLLKKKLFDSPGFEVMDPVTGTHVMCGTLCTTHAALRFSFTCSAGYPLPWLISYCGFTSPLSPSSHLVNTKWHIG